MKQKVALVLGSGGARGTAHIGVIRELIRNGYEISSIAGSSMGALVGGIYASGKLDEYESWLCSLSKVNMFNLVDFTLSKKGIIKADKVLRKIQTFIPDQNIEDLPIKFAAVTTDLRNNREVVLTEGSLFEAIRASISIPMVITPAVNNETLFVDGGVLNPVPVNRVFRQKNDILIAVNVNAQIPHQTSMDHNAEWRFFEKRIHGKLNRFQRKLKKLVTYNNKNNVGYLNLIGDTTYLMLSQISRLTLEMNPPDLIIEISRHACGTFDFYKAKELIELGDKAALESLEKLSEQKNH